MRRILVIVFFIFSFLTAFAQKDDGGFVEPAQPYIDSLKALVSSRTPDSVKAVIYYKIAAAVNSIDSRFEYSNLSLDCCNDKDTALIVMNGVLLAYCHYARGSLSLMLPLLQKDIDLARRSGALNELQKLYRLMVMYYEQINENDSVFYYCNKALEVCITMKDTINTAACYMELGLKYTNRKFYTEAEKNYVKALKLDSVSGAQLEKAIVYHRLGELYTVRDSRDYYKAKDYLYRAVNIFNTEKYTEIRYVMSKYIAYNALAEVYIKLAETEGSFMYADSSRFYNTQAMEYFKSLGYDEFYCYMAFTYTEYLKFRKKYSEAAGFLSELKSSVDTTNVVLLNIYYRQLREVYAALGDFKKAYLYFEKYYETSVALNNDSTMNKIADAKTAQAVMLEKMERENDEIMHKAAQSRMRMLVTALGVILGLLVLIMFFRRKANRQLSEKNKMLDAQKTELQIQKEIIMQQWHEVEDANKKILSSINYARRIQRAAISPESEVNGLFPDNFVYYRPRDIVSGDYYRVAKCGKYHVLITADCTGHGIPGAFLSMLGISALKEFCVTEEDAAAPGTILDRMRTFVKSTLNSDTNKPIDDGMDMTVCSFDFNGLELRYATANQTAYIIRKGEIIKLKGDRMPVGRYIIEKKYFTSYTQPLEKGDVVYTFSDGIPDQPGGELKLEMGRKFLIKNLIAFLSEIYMKPFDEQCRLIDEKITDWRNGRPQVDDMTLIGVRV
jgi:serine phosphatase RsbU (regulator of sigma subunit)